VGQRKVALRDFLLIPEMSKLSSIIIIKLPRESEQLDPFNFQGCFPKTFRISGESL
jgi:hypothetical protein